MAAPTVQAVGSFPTASSSITPTPPTHQADDILFVAGVSTETFGTAPAGWTEITTLAVSGIQYGWYWKRATGAGTAGPTLVSDRGADIQACVVVMRGCITSGTPFEDGTTTGSSDATPDTATTTSTGPDRLGYCVYIQNGTTDFSSGYPPSGWASSQNTTDNGTVHRHVVMTKTHSSIGDLTTVVIGTLSLAKVYGAYTLLWIPQAVNVTVTAVRASALGDGLLPVPTLGVSPAAGIARKGTVTHVPGLNVTAVVAHAVGDVGATVVSQVQEPPFANVAVGSA